MVAASAIGAFVNAMHVPQFVAKLQQSPRSHAEANPKPNPGRPSSALATAPKVLPRNYRIAASPFAQAVTVPNYAATSARHTAAATRFKKAAQASKTRQAGMIDKGKRPKSAEPALRTQFGKDMQVFAANRLLQGLQRRVEAARKPIAVYKLSDGELSQMEKLLTLDNDVVDALGRGDIRLVRSSWIRALPPGSRVKSRNLLEKTYISPSPLLDPSEAVALFCSCRRAVGALSYCWLTASDPDPSAARLNAIQATLTEHSHIEGVFWDISSLYQKPRTAVQEDGFKRAMEVVAAMYASAVGTTVLVLKDIPQRPPQFDGSICIGKPDKAVDSTLLHQVFGTFGTIINYDLSREPATLRFTMHDAAIRAAEANAPALCEWIAIEYNERDYDTRGWCVFEEAISFEVVVRLMSYPGFGALMRKLPPKVLAIDGNGSAQAIPVESKLQYKLGHAGGRIQKATFGWRDDADVVAALYNDYTARVANNITELMRQVNAEADMDEKANLEIGKSDAPSFNSAPADPVRPAQGQLMLKLSDAAARRAGRQGATQLTAFEMIDKTLTLSAKLQGGPAKVDKKSLKKEYVASYVYDDFSQVVLPWELPAAGWADTLLLDVKLLASTKLALRTRVATLKAQHDIRDFKGALETLTALVKDLERGLHSEFLSSKVREVKSAFVVNGSPVGDWTSDAAAWGSVFATFDAETVVAEALQATRALSLRQYKDGQRLHVRLEGKGWVEARVLDTQPERTPAAEGEEEQTFTIPKITSISGKHRIKVDIKELNLVLHPWNHAPRELPMPAFEALRQWHLQSLRSKHSQIIDALTGKKLDVLQSCFSAIHVLHTPSASSEDPTLGDMLDGRNLTEWLHALHARRCEGAATSATACVLLTGGAATGKSTLMSQVILHTIDNSQADMIPVVVKVQSLQRLLQKEAPRGLEWRKIGSASRPKSGIELYNAELATALQSQTVFTEAEFSAFGISGLNRAHFIKVEAPWYTYLQRDPAAPIGTIVWKDVGKIRPGGSQYEINHAGLARALRRQRRFTEEDFKAFEMRITKLDGKGNRSDSVVWSAEDVTSYSYIKVQDDPMYFEPSDAGIFGTSWNWVDAYMAMDHSSQPEVYRMLRQALMARRALILLDGLDEGGAVRDSIESHLVSVLAAQGHVVLVTSRPTGIVEETFDHFHRFRLMPLTEPLQKQAVLQRLGLERSRNFMPYLRSKVPVDRETKQRVTANPLMLSMIVSIFELRGAVGMPKTVGELYDVATTALLERAGRPTLRDPAVSWEPLLQAIFFQAHIAETREIEESHLEAAVRQLHGKVDPQAMRILEERVITDKMPLLTCLQEAPFKMQASHLSFQEFFAARTICEGEKLPTPPWQWSAWWLNTLRLGAEMGDTFRHGLLRAAGVENGHIDIGGSFGSDAATGMKVCAQLMLVALSINLSASGLGSTDEVMEIIAGLRKTKTLTAINLSGNYIQEHEAVAIGDALKQNRSLRSVDLSYNKLGIKGSRAIADAVRVHPSLTWLDTRVNNITGKDADNLAGAILANETLQVFGRVPLLMLRSNTITDLDLRGAAIGPTEAIVLARLAAYCPVLRALDVRKNALSETDTKRLRLGMKAAKGSLRDFALHLDEVAWSSSPWTKPRAVFAMPK